MSKWNSRDGILARHAGHRLVGIDAESLRCIDCCHTLLLSSGREVITTADNRALVAKQADSASRSEQPRSDQDGFGRRPCYRCGKTVSHTRADGGLFEPVPHAVLGDPTAQPCRSVTEQPAAGLPLGGWRELVKSLGSST